MKKKVDHKYLLPSDGETLIVETKTPVGTPIQQGNQRAGKRKTSVSVKNEGKEVGSKAARQANKWCIPELREDKQLDMTAPTSFDHIIS